MGVMINYYNVETSRDIIGVQVISIVRSLMLPCNKEVFKANPAQNDMNLTSDEERVFFFLVRSHASRVRVLRQQGASALTSRVGVL